ncbi:hypothetical protein NRIC_00850 [Enterococcus florum]|uniref:DUF1694 domain-containing protein n=1 Tax=Enterococcus florum TaxID=2480627 RepID=A0A4P5P7L4_9ENTE|nr:YueI family protein [Enterococcus florum]GCF92194.1 hypothetical protein NRIC_00850 [Enterococcus florum]
MAKDELQKHLDSGRYGTPKIKPDEQKEYLGTFRERCFLSMNIKEMRNKNNDAGLIKEIQKEPNAHLLINGAISLALQQRFMTIANKENIDFTIVSDVVADQDEKIGLLLVSDHAVDEPVIDVEQKYPDLGEEKATEPEKKTSIWHRLFQ